MDSNIVDGRALARSIKLNLKQLLKQENPVPFHIIYVGSDPVIDNYLSYKQKFGKYIGVETFIHRYDKNISEQELEHEIMNISSLHEPAIIQLPLPQKFNAQKFLDLIPWDVDVDVLSRQGRMLFANNENLLIPPVTGSILEIINTYQVNLSSKKIVLVGMGKLVGTPMSQWLQRQNYPFLTITEETPLEEKKRILKEAQILITGVGSPSLINYEDLSEGIVVLDAGTAEDTKGIIGDVDPKVAKIASLFTPVPGGIGPLTIALLYRNVVTSYQSYVKPHITN